ncbi:hypothetical protein C1646_680063 [Rhizophagus diaphanus]|nr:hypothetical protein C1646_680063 [Rhizophagus diaphanus] [Rhizophagus sp. MUCL 43196]
MCCMQCNSFIALHCSYMSIELIFNSKFLPILLLLKVIYVYILYFRNNISNKSSASRGVTKKNDIYGTYYYNCSNIDIDLLIGEVSNGPFETSKPTFHGRDNEDPYEWCRLFEATFATNGKLLETGMKEIEEQIYNLIFINCKNINHFHLNTDKEFYKSVST